MLNEVLEQWMRGDEDDLIRIERDLAWMQRQLFDQYEPDRFSRFGDRLGEWLRQVEDDEQRKAMFRLLPHVFFVGREQFASLYRTAYRDAATRWIIDQAAIDVCAPDAARAVEDAMRRTWFCPLTDSMRINSFLKVNDEGGHAVRPDWRSLARLGDAGSGASEGKIRTFVRENGIARLVLVEDFVGSGSQMIEAVRFARSTLPDTPILVLPLVCCPVGDAQGRQLAIDLASLTFEPVLTLAPNMCITQTPDPLEAAALTDVRPLLEEFAGRYGDMHFDIPYGFEGTGALVVLHTNCPDNTIPLLHADGPDWAALFPRINRN